MNPLSPQVDIPFRKGSVKCSLSIADVYRAEFDLNIPIISPSPVAFTSRPVMAQKACYLYAALASRPGVNATLDECREALAGPKSRYIQERLDTLLEGMTVELLEYHKQFDDGKAANGAPDPLAVEPGGPDNGLTPSPSSGSAAKSSGASRRAK